jgi:hypothetical protein
VEVDVNALGQFDVYNGFGNVDVIVDVVGYYEDHNHDDRYYTEAEINTQRSGEYTCGHTDFFPLNASTDYFSGTGTRYASGTTQLQCTLHLPVGARVTDVRASFNDTSPAAPNLNCLVVYYVENLNTEFQPFSTPDTTGIGLQTVSVSPPSPFVIASRTSYGVRCDVSNSANASIKGVTVSYVFS